MPFQDYEEFIAALNEQGVRYLIVGAHAVAFHARPRATKDLDIYIEPTAKNARKVLAALRQFFGGASLGYTIGDLIDPETIIQLGVAPVRIDLFSAVPGCDRFSSTWKNRADASFGPVKAHYLGLADLIRAKETANRPQDRADVSVLRLLRNRPNADKRKRRKK